MRRLILRQLVEDYAWSESEGVKTDSDVSDSSEEVVQEAPMVRMRSKRGKRSSRAGPVLRLQTPSPLRARIGIDARSVVHYGIRKLPDTESGL
ncbi:hypothetical protein SARC_01253 [Sphaeroforma arctica JP610]|uniref:Uncharacterized protein n=1 Tax=Sphaeroforma arctica JP610 TaxID=667725 RepID=A0A0L0GCJ8_9EUKA|nr:hypothetical protein SARC_01253 [Sphaeroforma arctica JP610]KNC86624.1 hypothetical protein SARC_01253 [Sphaeroforma arctica JP610]|eukprot:XP_014160526.1 hypothetical protein SARC_01253 [Sphaeroforma arctica JP610]